MKIKGCIIRAHTQYTYVHVYRLTESSLLVLQAELGLGQSCLPKQLSSPRSRPCLIMYSPSVPSGCGYMFTFDCPRIFDIVFIVCIFAREAANVRQSGMH